MAKKHFPKVYIALWMTLLVALGSYYLFLAPRDSEQSMKENRMLAGFPEISAQSIFSGDFGREFETYLLDRFPDRNAVIDLTNGMESAISMASHEDYLLIMDVNRDDPLITEDVEVDMDALLAELERPAETRPAPTDPPAPTESSDIPSAETEPAETQPVENPPIVPKPPASADDFPNRAGLYMDIGDGETALYSYSKDHVLASTAILNKYARLLPENGKLMFTVVPSSYWIMRYQNAPVRNRYHATWDEIVNALGDDNVYAVDAGELLAQHIDEYVIFRTDYHWTIHGAHLVYSALAELAGKTPCVYPDDFDVVQEENFQGSLFRDHPASYWNVEPDVLDLITPKVDFEFRRIVSPDSHIEVPYLDLTKPGTERYVVYLGGPSGPWHYMECDNDQTENCLVVCDSYGLPVVPMLTENYKQIHYYDPRKFDRASVGYSVSEMIEKYEIQDIYVIVGDVHVFNYESVLNLFNNHFGK